MRKGNSLHGAPRGQGLCVNCFTCYIKHIKSAVLVLGQQINNFKVAGGRVRRDGKFEIVLMLFIKICC